MSCVLLELKFVNLQLLHSNVVLLLSDLVLILLNLEKHLIALLLLQDLVALQLLVHPLAILFPFSQRCFLRLDLIIQLFLLLRQFVNNRRQFCDLILQHLC